MFTKDAVADYAFLATAGSLAFAFTGAVSGDVGVAKFAVAGALGSGVVAAVADTGRLKKNCCTFAAIVFGGWGRKSGTADVAPKTTPRDFLPG